ncbi:MAG: YihA family ribosome biogenesis GTP-binding protein [Clostridia bacterium]|nr:YihA family ribosome biogenesis GTP-binding protein [Clostridia bacterium]
MINFTKTVFVKSAAKASDFPTDELKHIVLAGRSNVGKSSAINSLVCRKNYARVSATPGKTVFINFFKVDESFWLVDLPGYGFAKTSESERKRFSSLIDEYFNTQKKKIASLYLLVDVRHKPTQDDVAMFEYAKATGINITVIANKTDKLKKNEQDAALQLVKETLLLEDTDTLIPFSAEKSFNRDLVISDMLKAVQK